MKRGLLLIALAMIASVSFAQVTWNVKAGMNFSSYWDEDDDVKSKVGFRVGGGMEYAFTEMLSLQPSVFVTSKGAKGKGVIKGAKINQVYLETPVMLALRFKFQNDMAIVVSAGSYLAYGIGGKMKFQGKKVSTFSDADFERFDFGMGSGVAFEFGKFNVSLDGQFGLLEVVDDSDMRNMNFSMGLGYRF